MSKPDFICIGLPKAGTTTLHAVLDYHPAVEMPPMKELKYFIQERMNYSGFRLSRLWRPDWQNRQDLAFTLATLRNPSPFRLRSLSAYLLGVRNDNDWYRSLFHEHKVSGDITPNYYWVTPEQRQQMAEDFPDTKILIMLRSPAKLHWSYFRMRALKYGETDCIEGEGLEHEMREKRKLIGRYADLVNDWHAAFGEENVMVGYFDDLVERPAQFYAELFRFLTIEDDIEALPAVKESLPLAQNRSPKMDVPAYMREPLRDLSRFNLEGYEAISPRMAQIWQQDIAEMLA